MTTNKKDMASGLKAIPEVATLWSRHISSSRIRHSKRIQFFFHKKYDEMKFTRPSLFKTLSFQLKWVSMEIGEFPRNDSFHPRTRKETKVKGLLPTLLRHREKRLITSVSPEIWQHEGKKFWLDKIHSVLKINSYYLVPCI